MLQNLLDLNISDADWTAIDAALATLETKLGAKLLDLTTEQRVSLNKMGDKSEAFCRQSLIVGRQNVAELTARATTGLTAAEGDLVNCDKVRPRLTRLTSLTEKAGDTEMALGSDIMEYSLFQYGFLSAIGAGAGLDELHDQLGSRFDRTHTPRAAPADSLASKRRIFRKVLKFGELKPPTAEFKSPPPELKPPRAGLNPRRATFPAPPPALEARTMGLRARPATLLPSSTAFPAPPPAQKPAIARLPLPSVPVKTRNA